MSFESLLADLADPAKRLTAEQLTSLSQLDGDDQRRLADAWPADGARRVNVLNTIAQLAEDNVELNFDAVFKNALGDDVAEVRAAALRGLHEYDGRDLIETLIELLQSDDDVSVRREGAVALGRYALAAELGFLLEDAAGAVRDALIETVENEMEDEAVRARALESVGAISGEEVENLIESIYREDSIWLKAGAVDAMGRSANESWMAVVLQEMENRAPEMRHAAAFAAGEIGALEAIQPLKRLAITDPDREVQLTAVRAIGAISGPQARVALKAILYEGEDDLQEAVQEALLEVEFDEDPLRPLNL